MPLQKILFKPGVNRENTRYTTEGGWYECDKVRFRQGNPEVIGGWQRISSNTYLGVCRSLWNWATLSGFNYLGVGTNLKFYIERGGAYSDITPLRSTVTLPNNPFTGNDTTTVTVYSPAHDALVGDFVTFSGVTGVYSPVLNAEFQIQSIPDLDHYTITTSSPIPTGSTGGVNVSAAYQIHIGPAIEGSLQGWGAGYWSNNSWGETTGPESIRLWSQSNYGQNLLFCPRNQPLYYWQIEDTLSSRAVLLNSLGGVVTISLGTPAVITATKLFTEGTALQFGGNLPSGILPNTTYYVFNVDGLSFNLLDQSGALVSTAAAPNVQGVTGTGTVGTMTASVGPNLSLTSVSATGSVGIVTTTRTLTAVNATGTAGTVTAIAPADKTVGITGNYAFTNVGAVAVSGSVTAFISKIVDVPERQTFMMVSDTSRFVLSFGANDYGASVQDPMLIRWSNQNDPYCWTPDATSQAGSLRLSHGSEIVSAVQTRQEIVVLTDASVYSLQYIGPPYVWQSQLLGDNISIQGQNAATIASGVVYWMGVDKFYAYDGRVQTLNCDLRRYVFSDINQTQRQQIFAGTNEGFNEVWWFYCSANSNTIDKYVVYNYLEKVWYYGTLARTAWSDSGLRPFPQAATYSNNIVNHEEGLNDNETATTAPISAYIASSEFDIGDGHNFGFVWRILPDLTFENASNAPNGDAAKVTMELYGLTNSGSGVTSDASQPVSKGSTYYITEEFTGQIYTRFRGRQMIFKIKSEQINTTWQLGAPRIDIRPDGRR